MVANVNAMSENSEQKETRGETIQNSKICL